MDGLTLFIGVLNPGESIVWSYQPQQISGSRLKRFAIIATVPWFMAFMLLHDLFRNGQQLPLLHRAALLCAAGWFFILPVFLSWLNFLSARNTTYALTDRRMLMALGPQRKDIRAVALTALGRVHRISAYGGRGKLLLTLRRPERTFFGPKSVWTFLDTGETDERATPYLCVDDPASVQQLLENARNAVWYPTTGLTDLTSLRGELDQAQAGRSVTAPSKLDL